MALAPLTFVIFGATGDLTKRKLIPALYSLRDQLDPRTRIIAIGRRPYTDAQMISDLAAFIEDRADWDAFSKRITYQQLEFHEDEPYLALQKKIKGIGNRLKVFYFATAPESFPVIINKLHKYRIATKESTYTTERLVFEKPFGSDLKSARRLNKEIGKLFNERQIFRIDHYLGKEFVQNIMALRFTNPIFEGIWNAKHVDNVQIVVTETKGVEERGKYYEGAGAIRDMMQNHLLQLLALTILDAPKSLNPDEIRGRKVAALKNVRFNRKDIVIGQYAAGQVEGKPNAGYRKENDVNPRSMTETFVAVKFEVPTPRWRGVPFYLRTGKALKHSYAQIVIQFKSASCKLFCGKDGKIADDTLIIRIQPDEGVELQFNLKEQNTQFTVPLTMEYVRNPEFAANTTAAYRKLLLDIMHGDQTLFTRWDETEQQWKIADALVAAKGKLQSYDAGTHGPAAALKMLTKDGRDWFGNRPLTHYLRSRTAAPKIMQK